MAGHVFDFVGFVEHHGVVLGQNAAFVIFVFDRQVGEKQVVVDDDDVALGGPLVHQGDEAALEIGTLLAGAQVAARVHFGPRGGVFGQGLDFRAVAEFGGLLPFADDFEIGHLFQAGEHGLFFGVVDFLPAGVVIAALHVADFQRPREMLLEKRDVFEKQLLLEILGAGGDHHALARRSAGTRYARVFPVPVPASTIRWRLSARAASTASAISTCPRGIHTWDATWRASRAGKRIDARRGCGSGWTSGCFDSNRLVVGATG